MYLEPLKTGLVEALRAQFDDGYPDPELRNLRCSIEFPIAEQDYPGLWVQYEDTQELQSAGIGHIETVTNEQGAIARLTRWRFGGTATITGVALTSRERDRIFDALVRTIAFAKVDEEVSEFRRRVEQNDLIAINANFDNIQPSGDNAAQGTPWGTEHVIYEKSLSIDLIGEFVSDVRFGDIVPLRKIIAMGYVLGSREPLFTGQDSSEIPGYDPDAPEAGFTVTSPREDGWH